MDWTRGSDDWEAENHRLRIEEDQEQGQEEHEDEIKCPVCGEWHAEDEDCAYID